MRFREALEELDRKREADYKESSFEQEFNTDNFSEAVKIVFRGIDISLYFVVLFLFSKISSSICCYFIKNFLPENIRVVCSCVLGCLFGLLYIVCYGKIRDNILGLGILKKYSNL